MRWAQNVHMELDVPREDGRGWRRTHSFTETQDDHLLNAQWCKDIQKGASHLLEETWVKASEAHYDAKVFPHVHPYGTGSVYSEPGAGGIQHHARNRLTNIQSWFRRSSTWGFWFLTRLIQSELFFKNARRRELGRKTASPADDKTRSRDFSARPCQQTFQNPQVGGSARQRTSSRHRMTPKWD